MENVSTPNISLHLTMTARRLPDKKAVICPDGGAMTFRELDEEVDRLAHAFREIGIVKGVRTILMVRPSLDLFTVTFALFRVGAVPVMIDPGMGREKLVANLSSVEAEAFIGIPLAHVLRLLHRRRFQSVKTPVTVGRFSLWGGYLLDELKRVPWRPCEPVATAPDDMAAIFFTTGSTGPPKGVVYEHGMFDAQVRYLTAYFGYGENDIDLAAFPLFALFDVVLGMTAVIPDMDPTKPAEVNPVNIVDAVTQHSCTSMYASPALLDRVAHYCQRQGIRLSSVRRIITAGAPIRPALLAEIHEMLPEGARIHTPYGATEVLPVSDIDSAEILTKTRKISEAGGGTCVGRPLEGMEVAVIAITDEPIERWSEATVLPVGTIGEIVVKGPVVTKEYFRRPEATREAKIKDDRHGGVWHRMGDVGYLDGEGRLWFCGRKGHRVETAAGTMFTIPCEAIFNRHPLVKRSALVGVGEKGRAKPVICIELKDPRGGDREKLSAELIALAGTDSRTAMIDTVLYHPSFPVDIRHNAKIFREKLAVWAARELQKKR